MTLHRRTLIIVEITIIASVAILYLLARGVVLGGFARLEEQAMHQNIERAVGALSDDLATLSSVGGDWAYWDETLHFVEGNYDQYIQDNLTDATLVNLKLNFMLFINASGQLVYSKGMDLQAGKESPIPSSLLDYVAANPTLRVHPSPESSITGVVLFPQHLALVDSRPILNNNQEGPVRGTLIIGRYLDAAQLERLGEMTRLSLSAHRPDDAAMPADFRAAFGQISGETPTLVTLLNNETIAGYTLLRDVNGQPALILRVEAPRRIYAQGRMTVFYFVLLLLAFGLIFSLVILLVLDRQILSRLTHVTAAVRTVCASGDLSARAMVGGRDELAELGSEVDRMLEMLQRQQIELEERNRALTRRQRYLEAAAAIAHDATTSLDLSEPLARATEMVGDRLGFYHVAIYLLDPTGEWAVLQSASGAGGRELLARGYRLRVGREGLVGRAILSQAPYIASDVSADAAFVSLPEFALTRSEVVLPLQVQGEVIGALDVHGAAVGAFDDEDVVMLQGLADQIALSIHSARLFRQVQDGLELERRAYGELTRRAWADILSARPYTGYRYDGGKVLPLTEESPASADEGIEAELPIRVREHVIGTLRACKAEDAGEWAQGELTLLETLVDRLGVALENARLYQDAQRRATRERLTREITDKMRRAANVEEIVRTAVDELFGVMGTSRAFVRLGVGETPARTETSGGRGGNGHNV